MITESINNPRPSLDAQAVLEELIAYDSVSHRSNEAITRRIEQLVVGLGFETERTRYTDDRGTAKFNLVAKRSPAKRPALQRRQSGTSGMAYFGHTDVVSADRWRGPGGDPFHATIENGRMYGRGACDMKGSIAAMLQAASAVDPDDQTAPLWIVCTADEEVGFEGARDLVRNSHAFGDLAAADPVAIIGEPTQLRIVAAHKGIVAMRIHSHGIAAHSSTTDGINANIAMVPMLQTLLELEQRCRTDPSLRDERFDPPTLTFTFGVSDHMKSINIVPDHSTAWLSFRTMPDVDGCELIDVIGDRAASLGLDVQMLAGGPPMATPVDAAAVIAMVELAFDFIGNNDPIAECYATDGCVLSDLSQRIVCGPGSIAQAHRVDEFIELEQLRRGAAFYESAIRRFTT